MYWHRPVLHSCARNQQGLSLTSDSFGESVDNRRNRRAIPQKVRALLAPSYDKYNRPWNSTLRELKEIQKTTSTMLTQSNSHHTKFSTLRMTLLERRNHLYFTPSSLCPLEITLQSCS